MVQVDFLAGQVQGQQVVEDRQGEGSGELGDLDLHGDDLGGDEPDDEGEEDAEEGSEDLADVGADVVLLQFGTLVEEGPEGGAGRDGEDLPVVIA